MHRRTAFSLVEVSVACVLTAFFAVMLSTTWRLLMPSTTDLIVWGQLFQEMQVSVASLSRDTGGALPEDCSRTIASAKQQGLLLACRKSVDGHFQLCFDGVYPYGAGAQGRAADGLAKWDGSDTIIDYQVNAAAHTLLRSNLTANTSATIAGNVEDMTIDDSDPNNITITLTFAYHFPHPPDKPVWKAPLTRKCTLIVKKKP
jgi:hypothetical protein